MYATDDWKTEEMVRVEYGLDDAVERAYRDMYAADDLLDEIAANDERRADEYAEMWREHAHREDAPPAWRAVVEKVDAGELSWRDLASGDASDDPAVRAALAADNRGRRPARKRAGSDEDTYFDQFTVLRKRKR